MKSPKAKFELALIGREVFPGKKDYLIKAYEDATKNSPYSYIRIDFTQQTPEEYRVLARLTPEENNNILSPIVYKIK